MRYTRDELRSLWCERCLLDCHVRQDFANFSEEEPRVVDWLGGVHYEVGGCGMFYEDGGFWNGWEDGGGWGEGMVDGDFYEDLLEFGAYLPMCRASVI
jgi:hypothetical protein